MKRLLLREMQKFVGIASFSLLLTGAIAATSTAQTNWVRIMTDADREVWYIDPGSIQRNGPIRFFWVYRDTTDSRPIFSEQGKAVYGMTAYLSTDCRSGAVRIRTAEFFDGSSKLVTKANPGDRGPAGNAFRGHPVAQAITKYVCDR
jgi:hypothetical protein